MTTPKPIESLDEIRQEILGEFKNVLRLAPADYTENCTNVVMSIIEAYITEREQEAYRKGYNDNSRDCYCTGGTVPHRHLLDDGESHDIRPDLTPQSTMYALLRIMAKAKDYADGNKVTYEGLAKVYEDAVFDEINLLTAPKEQTNE